MKMYYIWDAYCGWSYGFNHILKAFMSQHPEIDLKMISGGLFVDEVAQPIAKFDHIPVANRQISQFYGLTFGQAYQELLEEGEMILDSTYPASAFALIKDKVAKHAQLDLALAIQNLFYQDGKSLSELENYLELSRRFGLAKPVLRQELEEAFVYQHLAEEEFELADMMGISSYPSLILENDGHYTQLDTVFRTVEEFEHAFQQSLDDHQGEEE